MTCVFGPYKITSSSFPNIEGTVFVDSDRTRRIAIISQCNSAINSPCKGAVAVSQTSCEESNCNIRWYECPSVLGRTYTLFPTPCGVTITSFEDGLLSSNGCSATDFGSSLFCFGRVYTSAGEFTADNSNAVSFEFDGHTFTIEGVLGDCNEFLDCGICSRVDTANTAHSVTAFATLPSAPPETADPTIEAEATLDGAVPEIEIIAPENRTVWHNVPTDLVDSPGTGCDNAVDVTSWKDSTPASDVCVSYDNPSVATLPSGHIIIAHEERDSTGLTRIRVAILKSSVNKNITYYRRLSKGTLINDSEAPGQVFEIFEDIFIETDLSTGGPLLPLSIGFLSGPLVGAKPTNPECTTNCLYSVDSIVRSIENNRVKHTITFIPESPVVFPDQNDVSNVSWFLADDRGGDIPPTSTNIITLLDEDLTAHKFPPNDSGVQVPVANPSIAVAKNNQMISSEQNIFLVYQAFEENQWRVYLRQIVLGGTETPPIYKAPYLFPDQSPVLLPPSEGGIAAPPSQVVFDDFFDYFTTEDQFLDVRPEWRRMSIPFENVEGGLSIAYEDRALTICKNPNPPFPSIGCTSSSGPDRTCRLQFANTTFSCSDNTIPNNSWVKSFYSSTIPAEDANGNGYLSSSMSITFSMQQGTNTDFFPEVWFLLGRAAENSALFSNWRIRIERHNGTESFGANIENAGYRSACKNTWTNNPSGLSSCDNNCFIVSIYNGWSKFQSGDDAPWFDRTIHNGTRTDQWRQQIRACALIRNADAQLFGDYDTNGWNTLNVVTRLRGRHRVFEVFLSNASFPGSRKLVEFVEPIESTFNTSNSTDSKPITFGKYYGFGFVNHEVPIICSIDKVTLIGLDDDIQSKHIFYEDFLDYDIVDGTNLSSLLAGLPGGQPTGSALRHLSPGPHDPNTAWVTDLQVAYDRFTFCDKNLDSRYPRSSSFNNLNDMFFLPGFENNKDHLTISGFSRECPSSILDPTQNFGFWASLKVDVPTDLRQNQIAPFNEVHDVTIYTSFSHGGFISGNGTQWGEIWFLMRQISNSVWHNGWRLRVRYYLVSGDPFYNLEVYDGDTSNGDPSDVPTDSAIVAATSLIELSNHSGNPFSSSLHQQLWREAKIPYLKVDITTDAVETKISLSMADKSTFNSGFACPIPLCEPSLYDYNLVHSFTGLATKHFGTHYGFALMSGPRLNDPIDTARDWRSQPIVDYIQIRSFVDNPYTSLEPHACCRSNGIDCDDVPLHDCASPDVWDVTATCATKNCGTEFILGASCRESDGECLVSSESGVPPDFGDFIGGTWSAGTNCIPGDSLNRNCPQPMGSCCKPDGTCSQHTNANCEAFWGSDFDVSYWAKNASCSNATCPTPPVSRGACCIDSYTGCHVWRTSAECTLLGGNFLGNDTDCSACLGSCCHDSGCADTHFFDCFDTYNNARWFGNGTTCSGVTCGDPTSDCCFSDGQCGIVTSSVCTTLFTGATWGASGSCSPNACTQPTGACCDPLTGICSQETQDGCNDSGKTFIGGLCQNASCSQPTGACCTGDVCNQRTLVDCVERNGIYFGNGSQCLPNHCFLQDPYISRSVNYKPEDLWVIKTGSNNFITRVLYHMQEDDIVIKTGDGENLVDVMLMINHSSIQTSHLTFISDAIPFLVSSFSNRGLNAQFSLVLYNRDEVASPEPGDSIICTDALRSTLAFNALQGTSFCSASAFDPPNGTEEVAGAWTKSSERLRNALDCWWASGSGGGSFYAALQFGINHPVFNDSSSGWRSTAKKIILGIGSPLSEQCSCSECSDVNDSSRTFRTGGDGRTDAIAAFASGPVDSTEGVFFVPIVGDSAFDDWSELSQISNWNGEVFRINEESPSLTDYRTIFGSIATSINLSIREEKSTVIERSVSGSDATYLKQAEVIITYDGDLSDLWTFNKTDFEFGEEHVPFPGTATKQISNFPFALASGKTYGIDAVHIQGIPENWVSFGKEGPLRFDHPDLGTRGSSVSDPILMSTNSTRPKVFVNNRNQVIVAYESYEFGSAQINIKGSGDFYQNSITGAKGSRLQRFYVSSEFSFNHAITLDGEGVNQLCDFVIDSSDITHVVWQSNRNNEWEIYYANSYDLFEPIRVTKSDSRSSLPSIDVEESGNIFVVYHDNRFGPFEVMLATKTEERVASLLEQDAYMASVRHNYAHYTNTIPIVINNPIPEKFAQTAQLWGSKTSNGAGNDNENYIYKLSKSSGLPSEGGDSGFGMDHIAFHPDGKIYGIQVTEDDNTNGEDQAVLYLINNFGDSGEPDITQNPTIIGSIDLTTWNDDLTGRQIGRIEDIDFDSFGRLWLYMWKRSGPTNDNRSGAFKWIDVTDLSVKAETKIPIVASDFLNSINGGTGFAIDQDNNFFWGGDISTSSNGILFRSSYPIIITDILNPSGPDLPVLDAVAITAEFSDPGDGEGISARSMTFDSSGNILVATEGNDLLEFNISSMASVRLSSLTTDSRAETGPLPVGTTASIAFLQTSTTTPITIGEFFHILIKFYDNFAMSGEPFLSVGSRENLEAFVTEGTLASPATTDDPYDPYDAASPAGTASGMDARGIFLEQGQTGIVFFDVSQFRPGFQRQSVPYNFDTNQTYFPKAFSISSSNVILETVTQSSSFSCSKCSRFGTNNFDTSGCSYSFVVTNSSLTDRWYNFQLDFYADTSKQHLLRRFEITPGHSDLQFVEVDNQPGTSKWGAEGLLVTSGDSVFIQLYPSLDASTGFLCGINYTVQVNQCFNSSESECSDFAVLTPDNWDAIQVPVSEQISTAFTPTALNFDNVFSYTVAIGLDMHNVEGKIALAYQTDNNNLAYITYNGINEWTDGTIAPDLTNGNAEYVSLGTLQGKPVAAFTINGRSGQNIQLESRILNGQTWAKMPITATRPGDHPFQHFAIFNETDPISLIVSKGDRTSEQYHIGTGSSVQEDFATGGHTHGNFNDTAIINGLPHCAFWKEQILTMGVRRGSPTSLGEEWDLFTVDTDISFSRSDLSPPPRSLGDPPPRGDQRDQWEPPGRPAIAELENGLIAVAYIKQDDAIFDTTRGVIVDASKRRLMFRTYDGTGWTNVDTGVSRDTYNKSVSMEIVSGQPHIAYSVNKGDGTCDLKVAIYNGSEFRHEIVAINIQTQDPQVDIIEFQSRAVITITASPLTIYLQRGDSLAAIGEISSKFFCECSSKIFPDGMVHLAEVNRWESSAHGHSDTRVTESPKNSLRPKVATRLTGAAIIVWEDNNCSNPPCIKAATFRNINQDQLRSSGTGSWYDFDFNTHGQQPDLALDVYDRAITTYEEPIPASPEGFFGTQTTKEELPSNKVMSRICDFDAEQAPGSTSPTPGGCDIADIEANVITVDEFLSKQIVKKIRVKDEFVQYYTYNVSGRLTAIVSGCEIILEIHGTPEIVAVRLRNENQTIFGAWCPWSPQVGDFVMEKQHRLSANTGIKEVCVQAMTYSGVTVQFCVPIIADYETIVFETRFYRNTSVPPEGGWDEQTPHPFQVLSGGDFSSDDSLLEGLPLSDGLAVANLAPQTANDISAPPFELVILVEIIPNKEPDDSVASIKYDVLQQGTGDTPGLSAIKGKNNDGKVMFRGFFTIKMEDKVLNIDGLARVSPKFPQSCDTDEGGENSGSVNIYNPDQYNIISQETEVEIMKVTDVLESYRQDVSGRVGSNIDIRSQEDPYFVFGDPNYSLRQREGERKGVPLGVPANALEIGLGLPPSDPCSKRTEPCPEGFRCDSATGDCVPIAPTG